MPKVHRRIPDEYADLPRAEQYAMLKTIIGQEAPKVVPPAELADTEEN